MIELHGTTIGFLGYGTFTQCLRDGMDDLGVDWTWAAEFGQPTEEASHVVWASVPPHVRWSRTNQWTSCFTMWEATRIPEAFRETFPWFDQIVVPCEQNREMFSEHHDNVVTVPLGYDHTTWFPVEREPPGETFRILCAGQTLSTQGGRKGFDVAVKAFQMAFPRWQTMDPRPVLVTKSIRPHEPVPFVESHVGPISSADLAALVAGCHAYVGPSRGEGWGYWPQQALATGMPTILSAIPSHTEFAHLPGFLTVPVSQVKADYFIYGDAGDWWEPDVEVMAEAMREVYCRWEHHHDEAQVGAHQMARSFTRTHMARNLVDALGPGSPGGGLVFHEPLLFPAKVIRRVVCDIGDTHYDLEPGVHDMTADAHRVLVESGFAE